MAEQSRTDDRTARSRPRHLAVPLWVTVIWVGLWGDVSVANVLSGLVIGVVLSLAVPLPPTVRRYRPSLWGHVGFVAVFLAALVASTIDVARRVLFEPVSRLHPAVVRVEVGPRDALVLAMAANVTTMTPGTMTLDVDPSTGTLLIHVLSVEPGSEQAVRDDVIRFVQLAEAALRPSTPARTRLDKGAL